MKRLSILFLFVSTIALCSCEKEPSYGEPSKSTHSFYVENKLDQTIIVSFSDIASTTLTNELDPDYQLNHYHNIYVEPNSRVLARYFDRSLYKTSEALNAFQYEDVLYVTQPLRGQCRLRNEALPLPQSNLELWRDIYWSYVQKSKYEAEYTLVVDQELWDAAFPEK